MSALIFVALAVAWAAYLVPIALKHHDEAARSRSVDRFSDTMRVLARREPVDRRNARLVVTPGRPASTPVVVTKPSAASVSPDVAAALADAAPAVPVAPAVRRAAARRAARRRRRVLGLLLVANAVVITLAALHYYSWWYVAIPAALLALWLVACRLMVRRERRVRRSFTGQPVKPAADTPTASTTVPAQSAEPQAEADEADESHAADATQDIPAVVADAGNPVDPDLWEPLPVTLPTYVTKPAARRSVRTIDLDSTGVWTSGRTEADSKIAREADEAERAQKAQAKSQAEGDDHRAVGS